MSRRAVLVAALAAAVYAAAPPAASAQCPDGARCDRITVPLDHFGRAAGSLSLAYATVAATGTRTGTLVLLSGGPGQAALPLAEDFAELLEDARPSYDIVALDQRGTGDSGTVACGADLTGCAEALGERRPYFNTPQTAHDLESLRVALAVDKLTLLGVSYGAKVAGEYARRYPASTAGLILDSPAAVDGIDGADELRTLSAPRVLREVCHPGLCSATVTDPDEALAVAAARLQDGALRGTRVRADGRRSTARVTEADLYGMLVASDLDPVLRAGLPAATASLAAGDATPLIHLAELRPAGPFDPDALNVARLLATSCIESWLPWAPDSPVASRADALRAFADDRADAFAPFSPATVLDSAITGLCANWPPTPAPERVPWGGPDVPVLVLAGRDDLRTPLEDARRTASQYPAATVLAVPGVGHSVLTSDRSGCAVDGVTAFLGGEEVARCPLRTKRLTLPAAPYAPATIGRLPPTRLSGLPGRTLSAVAVTLAGVGFDTLGGDTRLPGLRGGFVRASRNSLRLAGVEWIRGVRVSGRLDARGRGRLTISGRAAAAGTITYSRDGARGVLGGRAFRLGS